MKVALPPVSSRDHDPVESVHRMPGARPRSLAYGDFLALDGLRAGLADHWLYVVVEIERPVVVDGPVDVADRPVVAAGQRVAVVERAHLAVVAIGRRPANARARLAGVGRRAGVRVVAARTVRDVVVEAGADPSQPRRRCRTGSLELLPHGNRGLESVRGQLSATPLHDSVTSHASTAGRQTAVLFRVRRTVLLAPSHVSARSRTPAAPRQAPCSSRPPDGRCSRRRTSPPDRTHGGPATQRRAFASAGQSLLAPSHVSARSHTGGPAAPVPCSSRPPDSRCSRRRSLRQIAHTGGPSGTRVSVSPTPTVVAAPSHVSARSHTPADPRRSAVLFASAGQSLLAPSHVSARSHTGGPRRCAVLFASAGQLLLAPSHVSPGRTPAAPRHSAVLFASAGQSLLAPSHVSARSHTPADRGTAPCSSRQPDSRCRAVARLRQIAHTGGPGGIAPCSSRPPDSRCSRRRTSPPGRTPAGPAAQRRALRVRRTVVARAVARLHARSHTPADPRHCAMLSRPPDMRCSHRRRSPGRRTRRRSRGKRRAPHRPGTRC